MFEAPSSHRQYTTPTQYSNAILGYDEQRAVAWSGHRWRGPILESLHWYTEQEIEMRSGGIGIVGVIVIVLVILWLVGVIKL